MQRVQSDETRAAGRQPADERFEVVEIADAPILPRAYRVQLHGNAPQAPPIADRVRLMAFGRGENEQAALHRTAADLHVELVVARGQLDGQFKAAASDPRALDFASPKFGTIGGGRDSLAPAPVFQIHRPEQTRAELTRR